MMMPLGRGGDMAMANGEIMTSMGPATMAAKPIRMWVAERNWVFVPNEEHADKVDAYFQGSYYITISYLTMSHSYACVAVYDKPIINLKDWSIRVKSNNI